MSRNKILYAEDDETLAFLTKDSLEAQGYDVCHCSGQQRHLDAFRKGSLRSLHPGYHAAGHGWVFSGGSHQEYEPGDIPVVFSQPKPSKKTGSGACASAPTITWVKPFNMRRIGFKDQSLSFPCQKQGLP